MYIKAASAIVLALSFVFSPMALVAEKTKDAKPAKTTVKKNADRGASWHKQDWKTGTTPSVRPIPFQAPATRPAAMKAATTRPAGQYIFKASPKYDYFADHYDFTTGTSPQRSDVMGYVEPSSKDNKSNPFIYRRK